jgi:hypothetical protein
MADSRGVRSSRERNQAAIAVVARHFRATLKQGVDPRDTYLIVSGKRIAVEVAAVGSRVSRRSRDAPPRLRFDRVVLKVLGRLRAALDGGLLRGATVILTITAPIRLASRTAAALEERIRALLGGRSARGQLTDTVHGNQVQIRIIRGSKTSTSKLVGFVHNRDSDPTILFDLTRSLLRRIGPGRSCTGSSGARWLVVVIEDEPSWIETYRAICSQLFSRTDFQRILLVAGAGRVSTQAFEDHVRTVQLHRALSGGLHHST